LNESAANCVADQFGDRLESELAHDGSSVRLHRLCTDLKTRGNLLVGLAVGEELNDFALTMRQRMRPLQSLCVFSISRKKNNDIRLRFESEIDSLAAIPSLSAGAPFGMRLEDRTQSSPHHGMGVDQQDSGVPVPASRCGGGQ